VKSIVTYLNDWTWLAVEYRVWLIILATVGVINSVASLPAEWRATQAAVHTAIACSFLAVAGLLLLVLTWRRPAGPRSGGSFRKSSRDRPSASGEAVRPPPPCRRPG
jgi:hypothetical protein